MCKYICVVLLIMCLFSFYCLCFCFCLCFSLCVWLCICLFFVYGFIYGFVYVFFVCLCISDCVDSFACFSVIHWWQFVHKTSMEFERQSKKFWSSPSLRYVSIPIFCDLIAMMWRKGHYNFASLSWNLESFDWLISNIMISYHCNQMTKKPIGMASHPFASHILILNKFLVSKKRFIWFWLLTSAWSLVMWMIEYFHQNLQVFKTIFRRHWPPEM